MTNKTRKHIWSVPLVASIAIIGVLAAFLVLANNPGVTMAQDAPPPPDPCAGMTEAERAEHILGGGTCGAPDTGTNGDANGDGDANGNGMDDATAPSAPMNVRSEVLDNMILVRWNKPEHIGPEGAEISHYVITRTAYTSDADSPINESGGKTVMVGSTVREYRDQGLGYNTTYSHTVKAVNKYTIDGVMGGSMGPASAPVTTATATSGGLLLPELAPPGAPMWPATGEGMALSPACEDSIMLSWKEPADKGKVAPDTVGCPVCADQTPAHIGGDHAGIQVKPGEAMIVSYMVERSVNGGAWMTLTSAAESTSYTDMSGLEYGNRYSYRVTAMNNEGMYGEASQVRSLDLTVPDVPNVPLSPDADLDADDPTHVLFTWDPPAGDWRSEGDIIVNPSGDNVSRSLKYHVQRRQEPDGAWMTLTRNQQHQYLNNVSKPEALRNIQTQRYGDEAIPQTGSYKYRVAALFDGCLLSRWVVTAREIVVTLDLGAPSNLTATQGPLPGIVTLSWMAGSNSAMTWIAGIKQADWDAGDFGNVIWTQASSNNSHTFTGLDSGAEYVFTVNAGRGSGASEEWSGWTPFARITPN